MSELNLKKLAEQFDALAEQLIAIGGTFRAASRAGEDAGGDGKAEKPVRGKRGAKPAPADEPDTEITEDTLRAALKELAASKGKEKMAEALAEVGAGRLPDVDESQYEELMTKIKELAEAEDPAPKKPAKGKGKKAAVTYEDVEEVFKALVEADKAAAKKVLKAAGLAKLSEVDKDDTDTLAELKTAIEEAMPEDDDLVG